MKRARSSVRVGLAFHVFLLGGIAACSQAGDRSEELVGLEQKTESAPVESESPSMEATAAATTTTSSTSTTMPAIFDPYAGTNPPTTAIGTVTDRSITTPDGRRRHFRLYVPSSLDATGKIPLLIALHGGLGSSAQFAKNSGFDQLAESNRFIVAYPDGIGARSDDSGPRTWNGGYCCGPAARSNVDDVAFIRTVIDSVEAEFLVDPDRVFAAGHSNGAIMAYRLACELSDQITAIGVQSGSLGVDTCAPSHPVSVLHIHGLADTNHPIDGGRGSGLAGVEFRSARDAVATMARVDGCAPDPIVQSVPENSDFEISTWSKCDVRAIVRLITVAAATHAWMGHAAASAGATRYVGEPYANLDSSRAIWAFLASQSRD